MKRWHDLQKERLTPEEIEASRVRVQRELICPDPACSCRTGGAIDTQGLPATGAKVVAWATPACRLTTHRGGCTPETYAAYLLASVPQHSHLLGNVEITVGGYKFAPEESGVYRIAFQRTKKPKAGRKKRKP